jgi:hypothetical protein
MATQKLKVVTNLRSAGSGRADASNLWSGLAQGKSLDWRLGGSRSAGSTLTLLGVPGQSRVQGAHGKSGGFDMAHCPCNCRAAHTRHSSVTRTGSPPQPTG